MNISHMFFLILSLCISLFFLPLCPNMFWSSSGLYHPITILLWASSNSSCLSHHHFSHSFFVCTLLHIHLASFMWWLYGSKAIKSIKLYHTWRRPISTSPSYFGAKPWGYQGADPAHLQACGEGMGAQCRLETFVNRDITCYDVCTYAIIYIQRHHLLILNFTGICIYIYVILCIHICIYIYIYMYIYI